MKKYLLIIGFLFFCTTTFAQSSKITLKVYGFEENKGFLEVGLYNNAEDFPKEGVDIPNAKIEVNSDTVSCVFENLKDGNFAFAMYHDLNSSGEMDKNFFGIPTEDYVFSNYAMGTLSPPSFEEAKFNLKDSTIVILDISK